MQTIILRGPQAPPTVAPRRPCIACALGVAMIVLGVITFVAALTAVL